jgi:two-component system OmpR family sensor kinase
MNATARPPVARQWRALQLGFAAILALIVASVSFSLAESWRTQAESRRLLSDARQSAFLIGHTGQQLALLRASTEEAIHQPASELHDSVARIADVERSLDDDLQELRERLSQDELVEWLEIAPLVFQFRANLDYVLAIAQAGERQNAERLLEETAAGSANLFEKLDVLFRRGDLETQTAVREAEERSALARELQAIAGLALFACTAAVATAVSRMTRRSQDKLATYIDRVESSNRDLEAFAGRVAHDLKNVLSPLQLAGPMLLQSAGQADVVVTIGARVERVTRRAVDLLEGLLAFARAGAPTAESERASIDEELSAVLEELEPVARQVNAKTDVAIEPSLAVRCSNSLLHVVLLNVLSNSLKFLQGRDEREVHIRGRAEGARCVIDVEDTGPGIPPAALKRIFEPFFRVQGVRVAGSGIGLATVRRIVDAHQGSIVVQSVEGRGTRVRIELPAAAAA